MRLMFLHAIVAGLFLLLWCSSASAGELKTHYASIEYGQQAEMMKFGAKVADGAGTGGKGHAAVCEEFAHLFDNRVEKVETVLHLFPEDLQFSVVLVASADDVQKIYKDRYGGDVHYVAFYAPDKKTIYISVADARPGILVHELTHAILDQYFLIPPSAVVQEILAEFVELHMDN
jgi:hypothetical protein